MRQWRGWQERAYAAARTLCGGLACSVEAPFERSGPGAGVSERMVCRSKVVPKAMGCVGAFARSVSAQEGRCGPHETTGAEDPNGGRQPLPLPITQRQHITVAQGQVVSGSSLHPAVRSEMRVRQPDQMDVRRKAG